MFAANGDAHGSAVSIITKVTVDPTIIPAGFGLSVEQPTWEPETQRFYVSIPVIANNPTGCNYGQVAGPITCDGGMLVIDPTTLNPLARSYLRSAFRPIASVQSGLANELALGVRWG